MKKLFTILFTLTLVFALTACNNTGTDNPPVDTNECAADETLVEETCVKNSTIDAEALEAIKTAFDVTFDLTAVTSDLTLPTASGEAAITWASSNTDVITNEGVVTRPTSENVDVTLTATLTYKGQTVTKDFVATVTYDNAFPVLTIPESGLVTMTVGDATSLEGVTANDANDGDLTSSIEINGNYDINVPGYYDVVVRVSDSANVVVTESVTLQVKYADPIVITGETWNVAEGEVKSLLVFNVIENVQNGDVFDTTVFGGVIDGPTIFKNTTDAAITFTVNSAYGVAAILDANGVVTEGRDGANGRLVDDSCGLRAICPQGSLNAAEAIKDVTLQPGGFLVLAPNLNSVYNEDGRKFVNEQLNNRLGRVVPMEMDDTNIFTYADQAPYIVISSKIQPTGSFSLTGTSGVAMNLLDGIKFYDDNGAFGAYVELVKSETFNPVVSVDMYDEFGNQITVTDPANFTFENSGVYDLEITITDGTNERMIETQMTVIVFEELTTPAFRITGDDFEYIDLMKVPYTYNQEDTDDIDTGFYHIYDDYSKLINATDSTPHNMGWASFIIFDEETGIIEVNYNIFHDKLYVAPGITYIDASLFEDSKGLEGITDIPAGKILLVGPQQTDLRAFALSNTSRDLTGSKIEFINVAEVASLVPSFDTATLVIAGETIEITGYTYNKEITGTNNMPTGTVRVYDDYSKILGLDGTPLNMGYGSFIVVDDATGTIEVYANWANIFKVDGVDYVDGAGYAAGTVLDALTSLPAGKTLIVSPQGTSLRDELHNTIGSNTDLSGEEIGVYEVYEASSLVISYGGTKHVIELAPYTVDASIPGTDNMPTGTVRIVTDYNNIIGLDGTPLNMGWGSFLVIDDATGEIEVYANWANVFTADGVDYADGTGYAAGTVLDALTSLPAGKTLIVSHQGTALRDALHNDLGSNSDLTGVVVKIVLVD